MRKRFEENFEKYGFFIMILALFVATLVMPLLVHVE